MINMALTNLPIKQDVDSAAATKTFFETYGNIQLEFTANEVSAAIVTAQVLLQQAKIDGVSVFKILDTLKTFDGVQISALVAEILNNNRNITSVLGYKVVSVEKQNQTRNIYA